MCITRILPFESTRIRLREASSGSKGGVKTSLRLDVETRRDGRRTGCREKGVPTTPRLRRLVAQSELVERRTVGVEVRGTTQQAGDSGLHPSRRSYARYVPFVTVVRRLESALRRRRQGCASRQSRTDPSSPPLSPARPLENGGPVGRRGGSIGVAGNARGAVGAQFTVGSYFGSSHGVPLPCSRHRDGPRT